MMVGLSNFICFSIFFVVRLTLALAPCLVPFVVANCVPPDRSIGGCSEGTSTPPTRHRRDTFEANEGLSTPSTRARLRGAGWVTSFRGAVAMEYSARRRRVGTAVGWAVLLVSTSVEVCVARERAPGPESRRSRRLACRALCPAARRCQRCVRARFYRILAAMRFLRFTPRAGVCFAGGLARCGCGLPCLGFCEFRVQSRTFNPGCKGQIGKLRVKSGITGFFYGVF